MITAHLPSGYILARAGSWRRAAMAAAIVGAVFPDFDLFFYVFVDHKAFYHHRYWVHAPAFALGMTVLMIVLASLIHRNARHIAAAFGAGWCLHILLDAPTGALMWLWPVSTRLYGPPFGHLYNAKMGLAMVFEPAFMAEQAVWLMALMLWIRERRRAV